VCTVAHAHGAGPVARRPGRFGVEEEHPVFHVAAPGDSPQGARAVEAAIDLAAPMTTQLPGLVGLILPALTRGRKRNDRWF